MNDKDIRLSNGELLSVNINFYTLKLLANPKFTSLQKRVDKLEKQKKLEEQKGNVSEDTLDMIDSRINALNMDISGEVIYAIMRSNGLKVDREEAMMLVPLDTDEIEALIGEFNRKMEQFKKKEESKANLRKSRMNK